MSEIFDLVDEQGRILGQARRSEVHGNPALLHQVVHVLVFNSRGELFLQKRAENKDVQPGKWDTSVGGHVDTGELPGAAARRELSEELGIPSSPGVNKKSRSSTEVPTLVFLHDYIHRNDYESELVHTWTCRWDGPFTLQESELSDGRFWELSEIDLRVGKSQDTHPFTPNFLDELRRWREAGSPLP